MHIPKWYYPKLIYKFIAAMSHMQNQSIAITPSIKLHPSKFYTLLKENNSVKEKLIL